MLRSVWVRLTAAVLLWPLAEGAAKTKKGDALLAEGRAREARQDLDGALEFYERALSEDPAEIAYRRAAEKVRFQAAQAHLNKGLKLRAEGRLEEAFAEFQKAYAISPALIAAVQELQRTDAMIRREQERSRQGVESSPAARSVTPVESAEK